jgi:hypothetical protein
MANLGYGPEPSCTVPAASPAYVLLDDPDEPADELSPP